MPSESRKLARKIASAVPRLAKAANKKAAKAAARPSEPTKTNTGRKDSKGRTIWSGPRGGLFVMNGDKKIAFKNASPKTTPRTAPGPVVNYRKKALEQEKLAFNNERWIKHWSQFTPEQLAGESKNFPKKIATNMIKKKRQVVEARKKAAEYRRKITTPKPPIVLANNIAVPQDHQDLVAKIVTALRRAKGNGLVNFEMHGFKVTVEENGVALSKGVPVSLSIGGVFPYHGHDPIYTSPNVAEIHFELDEEWMKVPGGIDSMKLASAVLTEVARQYTGKPIVKVNGFAVGGRYGVERHGEEDRIVSLVVKKERENPGATIVYVSRGE